ncbi:MAG TPA: hypothetical protein VHU87_06140 [Rhizomicrobium sp.]|nr:hypothetical protein [Rhizomicrobium sp.]
MPNVEPMHPFEPAPPPPPRNGAIGVLVACALVLLAPSALVWFVRLTALGMQCAPGPALCRGQALGGGLRDALDLAWIVGANPMVAVGIAFIGGIAGLIAHRPLSAGLSLLVLPLAAFVLPTFAVWASRFDGCQINEAGVGDCTLWGAQMGMAFHQAARVPDMIYDIAPYSFALALMVGAIGLLFFRPLES